MNEIQPIKDSTVPFAAFETKHAAPPPPPVFVQGDFRPTIIAPGGARRIADFATDLGKLVRDKLLFLRAGEVWHFCAVEKKLRMMDAETFVPWVEEHVAPLKQSVDDDGELVTEPCSIGKSAMAHVLKSPQFRSQIPPVRWISEVPLPAWVEGKSMPRLLRAEGNRPTYYPAHEALIMPGVEVDEAAEAGAGVKWLIEDVLGEFPFWREDRLRSLSVVLSGMLTGFAQFLLPDKAQRPAFVTVANAERSGKTLLTRLMLCPVFGRANITPPPTGPDDTELPKALAALAFAGSPYVFLDNCKGKIGGGALEATITATVLQARILGKSEMRTAPNDLLFFFTGNNAEVTPDMRGRSLIVELFVEEAVPEMREVKKWLDESRVLALRGKILGVLWAIVREWAAQDRPKGTHVHGTFQDWADVIGGMLECIGLISPVAPPRLRKPVEPDLAAFDALLPLALDEVGRDERIMASAQLMAFARALGAFAFLSEDEPEDDKARRSERAAWGKRIERFIDQRFPSGCRMTWIAGEGGGEARQHRRLHIQRYGKGGSVTPALPL